MASAHEMTLRDGLAFRIEGFRDRDCAQRAFEAA
jgi:hypothetical protein